MTQGLCPTDCSKCTPIDAADRTRVAEVVSYIRGHDDGTALADMLPDLADKDLATISAYCRFVHAAVLVFPAQLVDGHLDLQTWGLMVGEVTPSVVVRDRLRRRYGLSHMALDVRIAHARIDGGDGQQRMIEIFLLAPEADVELQRIAADERAHSWESHVAFEVGVPDLVVLSGLRAILTGPGNMNCDGGGYNLHQDVTVLYFRHGDGRSHLHRRLELVTAGHHPEVLRAHVRQSPSPQTVRLTDDARGKAPFDGNAPANPDQARPLLPPPAPEMRPAGHDVATQAADCDATTQAAAGPDAAATRLLQLMTGAWTTQAIAVAAELSLADHLAKYGGATSERLAELTGSDPDSLKRLLRYLASLGVVRDTDNEIHLTALGQLLRTDPDHSLHALAQIYGGLFYQSFGELAHTVRTGQPAFEHVFGVNHFDFLAARPQLARLFNRAMAASTAMFTPIVDIIDFSTARVVVDVAGGNGELLGRVLRAAPHLSGVLFERPHVIEAARDRLAQLGCADRCRFVPGDLMRTIPGGGDIYLLSRILHDWDDAQGVSILRRCAAAMPAHAEMLIIERLLPEDGAPSLATAWDLHMMCNVGGRERGTSQYRQMLADAGFELTGQYRLPLDATLLRARRQAYPGDRSGA